MDAYSVELAVMAGAAIWLLFILGYFLNRLCKVLERIAQSLEDRGP